MANQDQTARDRRYWTIAYRKPRANRFVRKDLSLSWHEARDIAGVFMAENPGYEVHYTTNRRAETDGYAGAEDTGNILVDSGRRVRIVEETPKNAVGVTMPTPTTGVTVTVTYRPEYQNTGRPTSYLFSSSAVADEFINEWCKDMITSFTRSDVENECRVVRVGYPSDAWPTDATTGRNKTIGEMTPAERRAVARHAAAQLQEELTRNADAIGRVLDEFDAEGTTPDADADDTAARHARLTNLAGLPSSHQCAHDGRPCSPVVGDCLCECRECADRRANGAAHLAGAGETERRVVRVDDPSRYGRVLGASPDGATLSVLWSDNTLVIVNADDVRDDPETDGAHDGHDAQTADCLMCHLVPPATEIVSLTNDAAPSPCPDCGAVLESRGPFDGRQINGGPVGGHIGFGETFMCANGHWFAVVNGQTIRPEHILTVVETDAAPAGWHLAADHPIRECRLAVCGWPGPDETGDTTPCDHDGGPCSPVVGDCLCRCVVCAARRAGPNGDDGCAFEGAPLNENGTCPFGHTRDEQNAYERYMQDLCERHERECGRQYTTGGSDPYGTHCDLDKGHDGPHEGDDPFAMPDDNPVRRIRWNGGGCVAGDAVVIRNVEIVPAPPTAVDRYADAMMAAIHDDMRAPFAHGKWIPRNVGSFGALHDYCDANDYAAKIIPYAGPSCTCGAKTNDRDDDHTDECAVSVDRYADHGAYATWTDLVNAVETECSRRLAAEAADIARNGYRSHLAWSWLSPNGVVHAQMPDAPCATCGRRHDLPDADGDARRRLAEMIRDMDAATIVSAMMDVGRVDEIREHMDEAW